MRKDWLTMMASLFLFLLCQNTGHPQTNAFLPEKAHPGEDTVQKNVRYISITAGRSVTFNFPSYSPLLSNLTPDTAEIKKDSMQVVSGFLSAESAHYFSLPGDTKSIRPFFFPHELKTKDINEIPRKKSIHDWAFILLLTGFLLLSGVQFSYYKRMSQIVKAFFAGRFINQLLRSGDFYKERITYNLFLIFLLVFPLFLFEINHFYEIYSLPRRPVTEIILYLELFFLNLLLYSAKVLVLKSAGVIYKTPEITSEYIMTYFIFSLIIGVFLLVFMSVVVFTQSFLMLQLTVLMILIIYFYLLIRGIFIGLRNASYSFLYLLLFFFTIEILPLLIIIKILEVTVN